MTTTDLTAARALAESLYDSGDLSIDQAGPILAALDGARERIRELDQTCKAFADRDLIIQSADAALGHVAELSGPQGRVADVIVSPLARVLAVLLIKPDGELYNYIEWEVGELPETGPLSIALQRGNGKTPAVLISEARADTAALRNAIIDYLDCPTCHGAGIHWTDIDGEAEPESCDMRNALDVVIAAPHPGAALLAERDGLRAALEDAVRLLSVPEHAWDDEHEMRRDALEAMLEPTTTAPD